jgi:starch-binding outer membrane protein, SusD/RagB family
MKKNLKIYIISLVIMLAGCTDLEEVPIGILAPEGYYKSLSDVEAVIYGAYGNMASSQYYGGTLCNTLELLGDMNDVALNYSDYGDLSPFLFNSTNSNPFNIWATSYEIVGIVNNAIFGVSQVQASKEDKDRYEAEARFIRATLYYHLVMLFGEIPYIDNVDPGDLTKITKSSVTDVFNNIIEDLSFARDNLPMQHPNNDQRTRPSKGSAVTALASVYLTIANFQEAYNNAKWVIDNKADLNYDLEADYQDLWRSDKQDYSKEYIFATDFLGNRRGGDNDAPNYTLENDHGYGACQGVEGAIEPYLGWSMFVPSQKVYDEWDPLDYRRKVCIDDSLMLTDEIIHPYTDFMIPRPHAAKFSRFCGVRKAGTAGWRSDMNYVVYRYAEVLLIAAEAANEIGKTDEGAGYVNQVRERARRGGVIDFEGNGYGSFAPGSVPADVPSGMSKDLFRTLVLEERRIELAFEYKRWYDIKRRDLGDEVFGPTGLEPQPNFDKTKHYLLPIPQTELDVSPNLLPQNTGY